MQGGRVHSGADRPLVPAFCMCEIEKFKIKCVCQDVRRQLGVDALGPSVAQLPGVLLDA
jgi:hypothetical protein